MSNKNKTSSIQEEIEQVMEKLGEALNDWLNKNGLKKKPVRIPIPVDKLYRKRLPRKRY